METEPDHRDWYEYLPEENQQMRCGDCLAQKDEFGLCPHDCERFKRKRATKEKPASNRIGISATEKKRMSAVVAASDPFFAARALGASARAKRGWKNRA